MRTIPLWTVLGLAACGVPSDEGLQGVGTGSWGLTCVLDERGRADCWGITDCSLPLPEVCQRAPALCPGAAEVLPPNTAGLSDLRVGSLHACALTPEQEGICWGEPRDGQLEVPPRRWTRLSPGGWHTCGVDIDGQLACWGDGSAGQTEPPDVAEGWRDVSAAGSYSCGVTSGGEIRCWGLGPRGQISDAPTEGTWRTVHTSDLWACAHAEDGRLSCWGQVPEGLVVPSEPVAAVSVGSAHACWLDARQAVGCAGSDARAVPPMDLRARAVAAGVVHTCAVDLTGELVCWGSPEVDVVCVP